MIKRLLATLVLALFTFAAVAVADAEPNSGTRYAAADAPANPAVRPSGWAVNKGNVTKQDMDAAEGAANEASRINQLPRLKQELLRRVQDGLPKPGTAQFRGAYFNTTQTAVCGEVDFEYWPSGRPVRSGYRKFIAATSTYRNGPYDNAPGGSGVVYKSAVDIDYRDSNKKYAELAAKVDCTPDRAH